jgi:hypothetical protein
MAGRILKGVISPVMILATLIVIGGFLIYSGTITIPASLDTSCQILLPKYCNYECLGGTSKTVNYVGSADGYDCGWGYTCVQLWCAYADMDTNGKCVFKANSDYMFFNDNSNDVIMKGQTREFSYGEFIKVSSNYQEPKFGLTYPTKYLRYQNSQTGQLMTANGCDMNSLNIGYEQYKYLPTDAQIALSIGESQSYVCGFDGFPIFGNYQNYNGQDVICEKKGDATATLSTVARIDTKGAGCYYYPKTVIASVACCPGDQWNNQVCGSDFVWHSTSGGGGVDTGCCSGGICSDVKCPGEGGFDYDSCTDPPCTVKKYECEETSGLCKVVDTKGIDCYYDSDCSPGLSCDRGTGTCVDKVVPVTCTQAGHECCEYGMFAPNVGLKSCKQAGFPEDYVCVNGECQSSGSDGCDFWCQLTRNLALLAVAFIVGLIITGIIAFILKFPLRSPVIFLLMWIAISLVLFFSFSGLLAVIGELVS